MDIKQYIKRVISVNNILPCRIHITYSSLLPEKLDIRDKQIVLYTYDSRHYSTAQIDVLPEI